MKWGKKIGKKEENWKKRREDEVLMLEKRKKNVRNIGYIMMEIIVGIGRMDKRGSNGWMIFIEDRKIVLEMFKSVEGEGKLVDEILILDWNMVKMMIERIMREGRRREGKRERKGKKGKKEEWKKWWKKKKSYEKKYWINESYIEKKKRWF